MPQSRSRQVVCLPPSPRCSSAARHRVDRRRVRQAAVDVGIDRHAAPRVGVPVLPGVVGELLAVDVDDLQDVDAVLLGEREVSLVVRRHAHYRAVAIAHQHVVADPQRNALVAERVHDREAGVDAVLVLRRQLGFGGAAGLADLEEGCDLGFQCRRAQRERVLRRHGAEGDAHDGVGTGREDVEPAAADRLCRRRRGCRAGRRSARPRSCRSSSPA